VTPRGTLGLIGVFALLAAYLLLVPAPAPPALEEPLLTVPTDSVDALEVSWPDRQLRAHRNDGGWRLNDGAAVPSDMVQDLLATLSTLRPMETLRSGDDVADYGLDARAPTLIVSAGGTDVLRLRIGDRNPAWTGVYVQRSGSQDVVVVGALLRWELEKLHATATR